jgi:glycosyltransferase involved in cell wall biosynthesis
MLDASVIICAYTAKRWDDLFMAVESVQRQTQPPHEIIVVIDHNPRLFIQLQLQARLNGVVLIENTEPRGLSGARNSGIARATGKYVAFLDDDAIAEPNWLELLHACCSDPEVLGVGGVVKPMWLCDRPGWFPTEFYWVLGCSYDQLPVAPVVVRNPFGGCCYMRREIFEGIGGFRNGIGRVGNRPVGGEETELSIRAKRQWPEKKFLWEPRAIIHHRIASDRASWNYFRSRCYCEGLSKAIISRHVGMKDSLASERRYTFATLPLGVLRALGEGLVGWKFPAYQRAGSIIVGLAVTTAGYFVGTFFVPGNEKSVTLARVPLPSDN